MALPPQLMDSLALKLFVMLRSVGETAVTPDLLGRHLDWVIAQERAGHVFLSGPLAPASRPLHGLTILRAADRAAAETIARQDPFVTEGVVTFALHEWTALEGAIPLTVRLSDGKAAIG